jgi:hypothetical protein
MVSNGSPEDICSHNIYFGYYVLDNGDLYFWLSSDVEQAVRFVFYNTGVGTFADID